MTLTTNGLGDYVPTTTGAKIMCSTFMYFGIACVGLVLGLLHANSLDYASRKAAEENKISGCMYCSQDRKQNNKATTRKAQMTSPGRYNFDQNVPMGEDYQRFEPEISRLRTIDESQMQSPASWLENENNQPIGDNQDSETASQASMVSLNDSSRPVTQIKAAKYIFLTLQQAFANTLFIIGIGSLGFMYFEKMTTVNSFYFTTTLFTTVGYGDIVPETTGGKIFAACFGFPAWICLLYNISMISMIPLEFRKRRIEHSVSVQVGDLLCFISTLVCIML
jgi:hypothetical protein